MGSTARSFEGVVSKHAVVAMIMLHRDAKASSVSFKREFRFKDAIGIVTLM
jgi:hypothetical protein